MNNDQTFERVPDHELKLAGHAHFWPKKQNCPNMTKTELLGAISLLNSYKMEREPITLDK